jgi:hypothetical protein
LGGRAGTPIVFDELGAVVVQHRLHAQKATEPDQQALAHQTAALGHLQMQDVGLAGDPQRKQPGDRTQHVDGPQQRQAIAARIDDDGLVVRALLFEPLRDLARDRAHAAPAQAAAR